MEIIARIINKLSRLYVDFKRKDTELNKHTTHVYKNANWFDPLIVGPTTFKHNCSSSETIRAVVKHLNEIDQDEFSEAIIDFYTNGLKRFGDSWKYADLLTTLQTISSMIQVDSYLEVGVRRGRSMTIVARNNLDVSIVGVDLWIEDYVGIENPGPEFVQQQLNRVGHIGDVVFISGDSRKELKKLKGRKNKPQFDLINIDGGHTRAIARKDLKNSIDLLKIGGIIVFDDTNNPYLNRLDQVWDQVIGNSNRFLSYSFSEIGYGVSFAIKKY